MEKLLKIIFKKFGISTYRTKNIVEHVSYSFLYKAGSVLANFLLVPLAIDYLNNEKYGIWLTLGSVITWFSFLDIGLGNGLRNKFAEAKAEGNDHLAQAYVSSAYFTIGSIVLVLCGTFLIVNPFIDWTVVFNADSSLKEELGILIPVVFAFFCMRLVIKLITSIYLADQHHSIQNKVQFFTQAGSLLLIWLLTKTGGNSLVIFGTIYSALPVIILLSLNLVAFSNKYKSFKPKYSLWKKEYLNDIVGLGISFFIIQIGTVILLSTDNFIVSNLFGPAEVVPYNISYKYFSIILIGYSIIASPYWSSFTEAYVNNEYSWIKKSVWNVQIIWLLVPICLGFMVMISDWFYNMWVGDRLTVPFYLSISMALFVALRTFTMIFNYFINGVGKIKLQLVSSLITMVINIPLSIFFGKYLGWGSTGVILATCFCLSYNAVLYPIQYYKLINEQATGIWNK